MKYFAVFLLTMVVAGSGYFWLTAERSDTDPVAGSKPAAAVGEGGVTPANAVEARRSSLDQQVEMPADVDTDRRPAVTREQEIAALEKEQELLQMAAEYETVRSDPEKRAAHREAMKQKLAAYSDAVLPIALEKAQAAQQAAQ